MTRKIESRAQGRLIVSGDLDWSDGYVLAMAIPQAVEIELTERADRRVRARTREPGGEGHGRWAEAEFALGSEAARGDWSDYLMGVTHYLSCEGARFPGFELVIRSSIPPGVGLGSSAALTVALLRAMRAAFGLDLEDARLAQVARLAESSVVGAASANLLDTLAASLGDRGHAVLVDARDQRTRMIALPAPVCEPLALQPPEAGAPGDANAPDAASAPASAIAPPSVRRAQRAQACRLLGVRSLRELTEGDFELAPMRALPEPLGRRVRHFVTENARALELAAALARADSEATGRIFAGAHASLREDEADAGLDELDRLVQLALAAPGVFAARATARGELVALAARGQAASAARTIALQFAERTGRRALIRVPG